MTRSPVTESDAPDAATSDFGAKTLTFQIVAEASQISERLPDFLNSLMPKSRCTDVTRANCEIVLAEVLNNIAEHSFADAEPGVVQIRTEIGDDEIYFVISDVGRAMPGLEVPKTTLPSKTVPVTELPEGGFGWFMIRKLARNIGYRREADRNILQFSMRLG